VSLGLSEASVRRILHYLLSLVSNQ
jgi:hypothetical protein